MVIKHIDFPDNQFIPIKQHKSQIVLHHTVSSGTAKSVANYWTSNPQKIATAYIIDRKGIVHQLFDDSYYAWHIGDTHKESRMLKLPQRNCSRYSIGIELISMGPLIKKRGGLVNSYGKRYKTDDITEYQEPFRSYNIYESYTNSQISSLKQLLKSITKKHDIPLKINAEDFGNDISYNALSGEPGIYSHTSFRLDKSDIHPQEEILNLF